MADYLSKYTGAQIDAALDFITNNDVQTMLGNSQAVAEASQAAAEAAAVLEQSVVTGAMYPPVYDPQNKQQDIFAYADSKVLTFTNISVPTTLWSADTTFSDYPYKADIPLTGVTANHVPDVVFSSEYVENSIFHYLAETLDGKVRIWAKSIPSSTVVIPTITCVKGVS